MSTAVGELTDAATPLPRATETLERIRERLVRPMPSDRVLGWALPVLVTAVAGFIRIWRITRPGGHHLTTTKNIVFDETYYAHDSWALLHSGVETSSSGGHLVPEFVVHPPLAKWMMAVGELIFDHGKQFDVVKVATGVRGVTSYPASPLSFRISAAVVGTLSILILARVARRMFRSTALGCVAGLLLAVDGLEFVMSRTALLDIFLMFWVLCAFACLVIDRDDGRRRLAQRLTRPLRDGEYGPGLGWRPWRIAAGVCLGAACGSKWNGAYFVPAFILLALFWDAGARRTAGAGLAFWRASARDGWHIALTLVVLPAVVYTACWTGWFLSDGAHAYDHDLYVRAGQSWIAHGWAVFHGWIAYHRAIYHYDATLAAAHPYLSKPWGWLILSRPVAYFYQSPNTCGAPQCSQEVLGTGNPLLWWASIPALLALVWVWVARRDWRAGATLAMFAFGYLPWVFQELATVSGCSPAGNCHRTEFLFYLTPDLPFMALAVTFAVGLVAGRVTMASLRRTVGISLVGVYLAATVGMFAYLYPILSAQTITYAQWHNRLLGFTQCQTGTRNEHHEDALCWI